MRWKRRQASSRRAGHGPARDYAVPPTLRRLSTAGSARTTRTTAAPTPISTSTARAARRPRAPPDGGSRGPAAPTGPGGGVLRGPRGGPGPPAGTPSARPDGGSSGPAATTGPGVVVWSGPGGDPATDGATPGVGRVPGPDGGLPGGTARAVGPWCLRGEGATCGPVLRELDDAGVGWWEGDGERDGDGDCVGRGPTTIWPLALLVPVSAVTVCAPGVPAV